MLSNRVYRSKLLVLALLGTLSFLFVPGRAWCAAGKGSLTGNIFGRDMRTPVAKAVVRLRARENKAEYKSGPTDADGLYSLKDLPAGRYILGISTAEGDYNFGYEMQIKADAVAKLALALTPGSAPSSSQDEDQGKTSNFFIIPIGTAVLIAAGGLLIYGGIKVFEGGETSASKK